MVEYFAPMQNIFDVILVFLAFFQFDAYGLDTRFLDVCGLGDQRRPLVAHRPAGILG